MGHIQNWQDGEIIKTTLGKYQFIKNSYKSPEFETVADLVNYEQTRPDKTTKRNNQTSQGKSGKSKAKKSAEKPDEIKHSMAICKDIQEVQKESLNRIIKIHWLSYVNFTISFMTLIIIIAYVLSL